MPNKAAHLAAAAENQRTIDYLCIKIDEFPAWITTVAFYKALHIVEALFFVDGAGVKGHTDEHKERNRLLKTTPRYQQIWKMYRPLFQASLVARYLRDDQRGPDYEVFSKYMPSDKVQSLILGHYLVQVQKSAAGLANDQAFVEC